MKINVKAKTETLLRYIGALFLLLSTINLATMIIEALSSLAIKVIYFHIGMVIIILFIFYKIEIGLVKNNSKIILSLIILLYLIISLAFFIWGEFSFMDLYFFMTSSINLLLLYGLHDCLSIFKKEKIQSFIASITFLILYIYLLFPQFIKKYEALMASFPIYMTIIGFNLIFFAEYSMRAKGYLIYH
jgi:hypothetical protein